MPWGVVGSANIGCLAATPLSQQDPAMDVKRFTLHPRQIEGALRPGPPYNVGAFVEMVALRSEFSGEPRTRSWALSPFFEAETLYRGGGQNFVRGVYSVTVDLKEVSLGDWEALPDNSAAVKELAAEDGLPQRVRLLRLYVEGWNSATGKAPPGEGGIDPKGECRHRVQDLARIEERVASRGRMEGSDMKVAGRLRSCEARGILGVRPPVIRDVDVNEIVKKSEGYRREAMVRELAREAAKCARMPSPSVTGSGPAPDHARAVTDCLDGLSEASVDDFFAWACGVTGWKKGKVRQELSLHPLTRGYFNQPEGRYKGRSGGANYGQLMSDLAEAGQDLERRIQERPLRDSTKWASRRPGRP